MNMKTSKRGAIELSFSMIFSIILIVAFIMVAFYAIKTVLNLGKCSEIGMFKDDLQQGIDSAWSSDGTSETLSISLPSSLNKVCFIDISKEAKGEDAEKYETLKKYGIKPGTNFFFYPLKNAVDCKMESFEILHINIENITQEKNPYCADNVNRKVSLKVEKGIYDELVCVNCGENSGVGGFCGSSTLASCSFDSDCKIGGCSSQVCQGKNEEGIITTCEYRECYNSEEFGVSCGCVYGKCKWS